MGQVWARRKMLVLREDVGGGDSAVDERVGVGVRVEKDAGVRKGVRKGENLGCREA